MELNKYDFNFGSQGGKEKVYGLRKTTITLDNIMLTDRQTGKVLVDTTLWYKPKDIVVDGKNYCTIEYDDHKTPAKLTFDWCNLTVERYLNKGVVNSYWIEVSNPNPQKYILTLTISGIPGIKRKVTIQ